MSGGRIIFLQEYGGNGDRWGGEYRLDVKYGDYPVAREVAAQIVGVKGNKQVGDDIEGMVSAVCDGLPPIELGEYQLTFDP